LDKKQVTKSFIKIYEEEKYYRAEYIRPYLESI